MKISIMPYMKFVQWAFAEPMNKGRNKTTGRPLSLDDRIEYFLTLTLSEGLPLQLILGSKSRTIRRERESRCSLWPESADGQRGQTRCTLVGYGQALPMSIVFGGLWVHGMVSFSSSYEEHINITMVY